MVTFSVIKANTGGYVGHSAVHPRMLASVVRSENGLLATTGNRSRRPADDQFGAGLVY